MADWINTDVSPGDPGYGWEYYSDGTAIDPSGNYYQGGSMIWSPSWSVETGVTAAPNDGSWLDGAFRTVNGIANNVMGIYAGVAQIDAQKNAIDIQRTISTAQASIAKSQAQGAVSIAQRQAAAAADPLNLDQSLENLNTRLNAMTAGNSAMLWLTIAGVVIAFMQMEKGKH